MRRGILVAVVMAVVGCGGGDSPADDSRPPEPTWSWSAENGIQCPGAQREETDGYVRCSWECAMGPVGDPLFVRFEWAKPLGAPPADPQPVTYAAPRCP